MKNNNKYLVLIICIFFGYLGIHRFYTSKTKSGLLYLFTLGVFGIGWIVDIILILTDKFTIPEKITNNNNFNTTTLYSKEKINVPPPKRYILNTSNMAIHELNCSRIQKIHPSNQFVTSDIQSALNKGYHNCRLCNPLIRNGSFTPSVPVTLKKESTVSNNLGQPDVFEYESDTMFKGTIAKLSDRRQKDDEADYEFRVAGVSFEGRQKKLEKIYETGVKSASLQWTEWEGEPAIKVICNRMDIGRIPADDVEFFMNNEIICISEIYIDCFEEVNDLIYYAKISVTVKDNF